MSPRPIEDFARTYLKVNLVNLPAANQLLFKRMYSHKDLTKDIHRVVDDLQTQARASE